MTEKDAGQKQEKPVMISYTEAEVDYQEDLLGKLMTLDHIIGMLGRGEEDKVFVHHVRDMKSLFQQRYADFIALKRSGGFLEFGEAEPEAGENTGESPGSAE